MALAGDNLVIDFNMTPDNIDLGSRLRIGEAVIELTDVPHTGCDKFLSRFGLDVCRYVNLAQGRRLRLRGGYARIVKAGRICVGDTTIKA